MKETVEIRIDSKGGFTFKAKEGFSGTSCVERTKDLELALGGKAITQNKTKEYYDPEQKDPLKISFDR